MAAAKLYRDDAGEDSDQEIDESALSPELQRYLAACAIPRTEGFLHTSAESEAYLEELHESGLELNGFDEDALALVQQQRARAAQPVEPQEAATSDTDRAPPVTEIMLEGPAPSDEEPGLAPKAMVLSEAVKRYLAIVERKEAFWSSPEIDLASEERDKLQLELEESWAALSSADIFTLEVILPKVQPPPPVVETEIIEETVEPREDMPLPPLKDTP